MRIQEQNYDFRARRWQVHKPSRRAGRAVKPGELLLDESWSLCAKGGEVTGNAVADLQDYFYESMGLSLRRTDAPGEHVFTVKIDESLEKGFVLEVSEDTVTVRIAADDEAFRATVYAEDVMNLEGAPVLPLGETVRRPMFRYRSIHSGCGIDEYPDAELRATVHAGYDAIVIFVKAIDTTTQGYCNINDVIRRAKKFGIKTILYNYIRSYIHPDDPGAQELFDRVYGGLFRKYPDAIAMMLCGESLEFPSKDPHTTGKRHTESVIDGIPDTRPSPGWYPCEDYPAYLDGIAKAVHKVKPDARVIYSTYNWNYESPELRRSFLERLKPGLDLTVTYEIGAKRTLEGLQTPVMDYTMSAEDPGEYFVTECSAAHELGIPIQGNTNSAGTAWDFGCVPYVPAPYKQLARLRNLRKANREWGVECQYATHHFGWWGGVPADLAKWYSWEEEGPDAEELLDKVAVRDYGEAAAPFVREAWRIWSRAMDHYIASNEDQYGPWRVGAAYPFIFQPNITRTMANKEIKFPTAEHAHFGYSIIKTFYTPYENSNQAPGFLRYPAEIRSLERMEKVWMQGLEAAEKAAEAEGATDEAVFLAAMGRFLLCSIRTTIRIKRWWQINMAMQTRTSADEALADIDRLCALLDEEEANVRDCIPAADADSRLGWEPSMEYVCDRWHLEWKLRQLDAARREIAAYRLTLEANRI